jgi:hypothetical protein
MKLCVLGWVCGMSACYTSCFLHAAGGTGRPHAQLANAHPYAMLVGFGLIDALKTVVGMLDA